MKTINLNLILVNRKVISMEFKKTFVEGKITGAGFNNEATYYIAYDNDLNYLHVLDNRNHKGTSLINIISEPFIDDILSIMTIDRKANNVKCIVYQNEKHQSDRLIASFKPKAPNNEIPLSNPLNREDLLQLGYKPFLDKIYN